MTHPTRTIFGIAIDLADTEALVALLNSRGGELNQRMGIRITHAAPEQITGTMPVEGNRQPVGLLHGGASGVLAETLGSTHAALLGPPHTNPVGTELSCSHHRSATSGTVTGTSTPLHVGRTMATFEVVVRDEQDRRLCTARLSCHFLSIRPTP